MCFVAGVDGGASRGRVAVYAGGRAGLALTGPLNVVYHPPRVVASRIARGLARAAWAAGAGAGGLRGVYACLAGMDAGGLSLRRARSVESRLPAPSVVDHDALAAWWAAWLEGGGAAVIAGTGSLVFHYDEESGRRLMLGDHGPLLGDQGSAFEVGLEALRRLGEALQGLRRWGCLEEALAAGLGAWSGPEAAERVYSAGGLVAAAAAAARIVVEEAEGGCGGAAELLRRAGYRLGRLVSAARERWGVGVFRVYGGLARSEVFMGALEASAGGVVYRGLLPPVAGAVWLALQYYCDPVPASPADVVSAFLDLDPELAEVA